MTESELNKELERVILKEKKNNELARKALKQLELIETDCRKVADELQQYKAIGTVSEFRELKEKATAKKPYYVQYDVNPEIGNYHCPTCEGFVLYTHPACSCGQKLDWSEGKE